MELSRILLCFLAILTVALSFPSRPLNERSTELALQAWLIYEQEQQQNTNDNAPQIDGGQRRRITPKSVFLAPPISTTLPPCAEGYKADSMGRCFKIVKIDNDAHLDYLLNVLKLKFKPNPNDTKSSNEPVIVKIPLPEPEPEMIIVTRTVETKNGATSVVDSMFAVDKSGGLVDDVSKQEETTTTPDQTETTTLTTTEQPEDNTSTEDLSTTTDSAETTTTFDNQQQALFFFDSSAGTEEDNGTEDTPLSTTTSSEVTSTNKAKGLLEAAHLDPLFSSHADGDVKQTANFVRFPSEEDFPSYASGFKHEYNYNPSFGDVDTSHEDDFGSEERGPSWSSSQLDFRFPARYRHSGRDFHSESYYRGFPGGSDAAHLFRHRPRGRFR